MNTNMMQLSKFVKWSVCGDGFVGYANHNKNAHYAVQRDPRHTDYIKMIEDKLNKLPDCNVKITDYIRKDNNKRVIALRTGSHPLFSRIRDRQYIKGHRVIDPHMLTVLDWEAAAILFMDDGSLCYNNKGSMIVRLSTCAYSYPEQEAIRKAFINKLGVIFNVNRNGKTWQLNLAKKSFENWFENIDRYILPSYRYKLPEYLQKETPHQQIC